jgi:predicted RNA-binding Zn-ribbon protein involved in translation (DUF1610 family)
MTEPKPTKATRPINASQLSPTVPTNATPPAVDVAALLSFLPQSPVEWWERWLGWRWPHFDQMESQAATTLTGSKFAVVRVGWNGTRRVAQGWHMTLFTLKGETPSPEKTVEAMRDVRPAGMVLHHVMTARLSTLAATPPHPLAAELTAEIIAAMKARKRFREVSSDPRAAPAAVAKLRISVQAQLDAARARTEEAITEGLLRHEHFPLKPVAVIQPSMLEGLVTYTFLLNLRRQLMLEPEPIAWQPEGVAVCDSCGIVFRPRRRRTAAQCHLCQGRDLPGQVFGLKPLVPGELQTFRAPKLLGKIIVGWKTASMGVCSECGKPFIAQRRDAEACPDCTNKLRQRRHRARRADAA